MKIELGQLEETDIPLLRDVLNREFTKYFNLHSLLNTTQLNQEFYNLQQDSTRYAFTIRTLKDGDFAKSTCGFCAVSDINWVARHGQLWFIMTDKHGTHLTIDEYEDSFEAFRILINYCFRDLNLNKVWIEVPQGLEIKSSLIELGFVAEGVRVFSRLIDGVQVSSTIFSLLAEEYRED